MNTTYFIAPFRKFVGFYFALLLCLFPMLLEGQTEASCEKSNSFTKLVVTGNIGISLERGEEAQICGLAGTNPSDLQISISENTLRISRISGKKYEKQPNLKIIYTTLNTIEGYSKADISTLNLIKSDSLRIELKNGSVFYADCDIKYLHANIIEGSLLTIKGYALEQQIQANGKATFNGFELEGNTAEVKTATGGIAKVNIEKSLTGSSSSGGHIAYKGKPQVDIKQSMGGKVVDEN